MNNPKLSIIAAIARNRAIGKNNKLLWHIPEDFKYFKDKTLGHVLIMGQKTYESIGRPLPGRITVVVSNDQHFVVEHLSVHVCRSLEEGIKKAKELEKKEIFICGGGSIYAQTIGLADKLYLTIVDADFEADTFFPEYVDFSKIVSEKESNDENFKYKFVELAKK